MKELQKHITPEDTPKQRLLDYALIIFNDYVKTKSMMKKMFKKQLITLNGTVASGSEWVEKNQEIILLQDEEKTPKAYKLDLEVVYEDEHFAIIVKPAGIVVSGNQFRTIVNALQQNIAVSKEKDALPYPRPVHRLDSQTSGLLIVAKTQTAAIELGKQLENKTIRKRYRAIVLGNAPDITEYFDNIENQKAHSELIKVKTINSKKYGLLSLVDLFPHTGRTHQLRIHCSQHGHPIIGDKLYGSEKTQSQKGLFLSAVELKLFHPLSNKEMTFEINQPNKFDALLRREEIIEE